MQKSECEKKVPTKNGSGLEERASSEEFRPGDVRTKIRIAGLAYSKGIIAESPVRQPHFIDRLRRRDEGASVSEAVARSTVVSNYLEQLGMAQQND